MTATPTPKAEDEFPPQRDISFTGLKHDLAKLAEELRVLRENQIKFADQLTERARRHGEALTEATGDGNEQPRSPAGPASPREYFASQLELQRMRERSFGSELFAAPAWDIMLELMLARIDGCDIRVSEVKSLGDTHDTETRRSLEALIDAKLVETHANAANIGDPFLSLSDEAARRMAELYRARARG